MTRETVIAISTLKTQVRAINERGRSAEPFPPGTRPWLSVEADGSPDRPNRPKTPPTHGRTDA